MEEQLAGLRLPGRDAPLWEVADYCRTAVLLAVDRLDDLAGASFTAAAGRAAADSLPWLEAEALGRHVLSRTEWGDRLAQAFVQAHDSRAELIRRANVFAGLDEAGVRAVLAIARPRRRRAGTVLAEAGAEATHFFLIEAGEVAALQDGEEIDRLRAGATFGEAALRGRGAYEATYRATGEVQLMVVPRESFDPLLRADTTLASQVSGGAAERELLKRMPLFNSLSPQQLAAVDTRLRPLFVPAGRIVARQGQLRSHLFIVQQGEIAATRRGENGELVVVGRYGPGDHFGEYALFANTPYQATYRAAADSRLLMLDEPTFDDLVAECAQMSHYVEQIGSGRLIDTRRRLGPAAVFG
jgi:CRP-like cAMP-binding protein